MKEMRMATAKMMERSGTAMPGMPMAGPTGMMGTQAPATPGMNMMMVPRCTMTFSKCQGGMKVTCACEDKVSAAMLQNLCTMMAGGMLGCCCMMNGMTVCCYNLMMAHCKCEPTEDGVCITCASGDPACTAMVEACCASMTSMMKAGCSCCMTMNNMPICCAC
jgi:hypothetical protein